MAGEVRLPMCEARRRGADLAGRNPLEKKARGKRRRCARLSTSRARTSPWCPARDRYELQPSFKIGSARLGHTSIPWLHFRGFKFSVAYGSISKKEKNDAYALVQEIDQVRRH
jgi:hypothetical protein